MPFNGYATPIATQAWRVPASLDPHRVKPEISVFSSHVPRDQGYQLTATGYDVSWSGDGTEGRGKEPFTTLPQAEEWARNWNDQRVKSYLDVERKPPHMEPGTPISPEIYLRWRKMFP